MCHIILYFPDFNINKKKNVKKEKTYTDIFKLKNIKLYHSFVFGKIRRRKFTINNKMAY